MPLTEEQKLKKREYQKSYYKKNKEKFEQYREKSKEYKKEYDKKRYEIEKLKKWKIPCICGTHYSNEYIDYHFKYVHFNRVNNNIDYLNHKEKFKNIIDLIKQN